MPATKGKKKATKKAAKKAKKAPPTKAKPGKKPRKPRKRAAKKPHGGKFTAAELASVRAKVQHLRAAAPAATGAKLASAKRAIADMESHLEQLERDRKDVRAFLQSSRKVAAKARRRPARRRRSKR